MNDNFGGQAEYNAIDFVKFIMALVVVAIHTEPFHGSTMARKASRPSMSIW